jgi:hypothetical protein
MFGQQWFESALRLLLLPPAFIQTTPFSFFTRGNNDRPWRTAEPTIFSQKNNLTHNLASFRLEPRREARFPMVFCSRRIRRGYEPIWDSGEDMRLKNQR